jgi:hypothetical protein
MGLTLLEFDFRSGQMQRMSGRLSWLVADRRRRVQPPLAGVSRTKIGRQVFNETRFSKRLDAHAVADDFDDVGTYELKPQTDRVKGGARKPNRVVVSDRADLKPAIRDVKRQSSCHSSMAGTADHNANRLHPTRAAPGVAEDVPTVDVSVKIELDIGTSLPHRCERRVMELKPSSQFAFSSG